MIPLDTKAHRFFLALALLLLLSLLLALKSLNLTMSSYLSQNDFRFVNNASAGSMTYDPGSSFINSDGYRDNDYQNARQLGRTLEQIRKEEYAKLQMAGAAQLAGQLTTGGRVADSITSTSGTHVTRRPFSSQMGGSLAGSGCWCIGQSSQHHREGKE